MKKSSNFRAALLLALMISVLAAGCASPEAVPSTPTAQAPTAAATSVPVSSATAVPPTQEPTPAEPTPTLDLASLETSIDGRWEGSLTVAGSSLATIVTFRTEDNALAGSLDIPPQNLFGYQLAEVGFDGINVHFEAFGESGRTAIWNGELNEDGTISGVFSQSGYTGTFEMIPSALVESNEPPPPYGVEEVAIQNGDIELGGTLTLPEGEGPFPVMLLISGSGAQNRDEEIFGFKMFGIIADQLTRSGIAVLRYDDRGVGASTGNIVDSTSADFATDVLAWVEYLKTRPEIDPQSIGLLGHSEGGIIAPMAAAQSEDIAMLVLMAGTAMTGEDIIYTQVESIARASGASEEEIQDALEQQRNVFDGLLRGENWEETKANLRQQIADQVNALTASQKQAIGDLDQYIETVYKSQIESLESTWYKYFLAYDPVPVLEQTTIPVLALFGGLDMQVPADSNAERMEAALQACRE